MAEPKHYYPKKRAKAKRTRDSYRAKTSEGKARQLENLTKGRGRRRKYRPSVDGVEVLQGARISESVLQELNIVDFAEYVLGIDFNERPAQRVILKSLYGLPLVDGELEIYTQLTTNTQVFESGSEKLEGLWVLGARAGKSFLTSIIALFEATRSKWKQYLGAGEIGYAVITATKMQQAQDIIGANCARLLENSKIKHMVAESWATSLVLTNGMCVASFPCNSTAARGLPIFLLIFDEIAHFRVEGPKADEIVNNALRPRMAQFPGAKCLKISTPSAKQGLLWDEFSEGFQVPGRLTIQATTRIVNPLIPQDFIDREVIRDPDNASREFFAEFAEQVDAYLPFNKLNECFVLGGDLLPDRSNKYFCGIDQSGLSGRDRFALAIAHRQDKEVIVDLVRVWDTKDGNRIITETKGIARDYGIDTVTIDRYGAGWVQQAFTDVGLEVKVRETLPNVYQNFKSLIMAGLVKLPDTKSLKDGLTKTQAYYGRNNSLSISHERSIAGHADEADAVVTADFSTLSIRRRIEPVLALASLATKIVAQANTTAFTPDPPTV